MKKEEIADITIHLWNCMDQAGFDMDVIEAFRACPIYMQKKFIEGFIRNLDDPSADEPDPEILEKAKKLVGYIE